MFTRAIVRRPGRSIVRGLRSPGMNRPDYSLALEQHLHYVQALRSCGLEVTVLPPLEEHPDSCFVEDVAVCTPRGAILTRPAPRSRAGEVDHVASSLSGVFDAVAKIEPPGTLEGGDVMPAGNHFYIGRSQRTNTNGAMQLVSFLKKLGYTASVVPVNGAFLHLKTAVAYLDEDNLAIAEALADNWVYDRFRLLKVPEVELHAANCVWINGSVIVPSGNPKTQTALEKLGYRAIPVDLSEFQKLDGGASCLSLRF